MRVSFEIPGAPYGKARHRTTRMGIQYTPKETTSYENLVKTLFIQNRGTWEITLLPIFLCVTAYYAIPKSASKKMREEMLAGRIRPTKRPDWDNIGKIISDSLNEIAYKDDCQVVDAILRKWYGEEPRVCVEMETYDRGAR
jgi:Holliday junction resolvase RusA-like endonuclease